jgi:ParB-like chromosome segregation protein Spo0J
MTTTEPAPAVRRVEELALDQIKPYPGNPRFISQAAVDAVARSIQKYGYRQPIVVDADHVIIVGHTRHRALTQLGIESATVVVAADLTEEQAAGYRLVDNRTSELGQWDHGQLVTELREWEAELLEQFFPDVATEITSITDTLVTSEDVDDATTSVLDVQTKAAIPTVDVECPSCHGHFEVATTSLPGHGTARK